MELYVGMSHLKNADEEKRRLRELILQLTKFSEDARAADDTRSGDKSHKNMMKEMEVGGYGTLSSTIKNLNFLDKKVKNRLDLITKEYIGMIQREHSDGAIGDVRKIERLEERIKKIAEDERIKEKHRSLDLAYIENYDTTRDKKLVGGAGGLVFADDPLIAKENELYLRKIRKLYYDPVFVSSLLRSCKLSFPSEQLEVLKIEEIKEGSVNLCLSVKTNSTDLFIKRFLPFVRANPNLMVVSFSSELPKKEAEVMNFLQKTSDLESKVKIPELIGYSEKNRILITKYMDGYKPLYDGPYDNLVSVCKDIGSCLRKLHSIHEIPVEISRRAHGTYERMVMNHSNRIGDLELLNKIQGWVDEDEKVMKTLIHGNFSPRNLIWDGRNVFLIDFQTVKYGDRARDAGEFLGDMIATHIKKSLSKEILINALDEFWKQYTGQDYTPEKEVLFHRSRLMAGIVLMYRSLSLYDYGSVRDTQMFRQNCYKVGRDLILSETPLEEVLDKLT